MRVSRDYALEMIWKVGDEIAKNATERRRLSGASTPIALGQSRIADDLWELKKSLEYRDITPKQAIERLADIAEKSGLVGDFLKNLLASAVA